MPKRLDVVTDLRIAKPCPARWADMPGDDHRRHCDRCDRDVFDLRHLTADAAVRLLADGGERCVRLHRRRDGTVVTADRPRPTPPSWLPRWPLAAWALAAISAVFAPGCTLGTTCVVPPAPPTTQPATQTAEPGVIQPGGSTLP